MWAGFPSWKETAHRLQRSYRRYELRYDEGKGHALFEEEKFAELFELFRQANPQRYNQELSALFTLRAPTPVYQRFLSTLKDLKPLQIVTTNVDEMLERNLQESVLVQSTDLERCSGLLWNNTSFIAKLHGSIGSVNSTVFAKSDYKRLERDAAYLTALQVLFSQATVVFVGYSLRDKYVLDLFVSNCGARPLFGDGPHFLVQSSESPPLPESIKVIRYLPEPFADHRSAITVLDIIRVTRDPSIEGFAPRHDEVRAEVAFESGYFLTDITPPGTWTSSQSLLLSRADGQTPNAIVGQGFDISELPQPISPAMHDLIVGLVAFDYVHVPLSHAARLHDLVGSETFWTLVRAGALRFIYFESEPLVMFRSIEAVDGGSVGMFRKSNPDGTPLTIDQQIRAQIQPVKGREAEVNQLFDMLAAKVFKFDHERFNIPGLTRGALLHPPVQKLLGISDATLPTSFPRWVTFPVIRLAHTVMAGCACDNFSLASTKLGFGSEILVGAAFAVSAVRNWADSVSSYVLTSRFNSDLGAYVGSTPSVWTAILEFRGTQAGLNLRREILHEVATNAGGEFVASVNAGLRQIVPTIVMDNARDQITELLFRKTNETSVVPAVWTNVRNSDAIARLWRARSRRELAAHCKLFGIGPKSLCPCRSGEKLRDCCSRAVAGP
ncbi:MAG: SIR2 family protein [Candidatus Acidiferrales bacterium]